jgi:hypothetical protein
LSGLGDLPRLSQHLAQASGQLFAEAGRAESDALHLAVEGVDGEMNVIGAGEVAQRGKDCGKAAAVGGFVVRLA